MGYGCIGCRRQFDKKGSLRLHEGKCERYKTETYKRRVNFSKIAEEKNAGTSREGQMNEVPEVIHPQVVIELQPDLMDVRTSFKFCSFSRF